MTGLRWNWQRSSFDSHFVKAVKGLMVEGTNVAKVLNEGLKAGGVMLKKIQSNESESSEMMMIWRLLTQVNVEWANNDMEVRNQSGVAC
ncbi:hypothetical protein Q3G72_030643 [Acer saccharum]|nr:hypothetical protein Q3G72_030643 [Acer saccharum]